MLLLWSIRQYFKQQCSCRDFLSSLGWNIP